MIMSNTRALPFKRPAKSNVPIRIGGSRGRTGCSTCKKRHVKCDETKPACNNCSRLGKTCGYLKIATIVTIMNKTNVHMPVLLHDPINHYSKWNHDDLSAMEFFYTVTTKQLGGPFSDNIWSRVIPLNAQHEPAIQSAIIAIGAFHRQFSYNVRLEGSALKSAIQNYIRSIHHVVTLDLSDDHALDTALITCLLVIVLEALQGHLRSTLLHVKSGIRLLLEAKRPSSCPERCQSAIEVKPVSTQNEGENGELDSVLLWLDALTIHEGDVENRSSLPQAHSPALPTIPEVFSTFTEAHQSFVKLFNVCSQYCQWLCPIDPSSSSPFIAAQAQASQYCLFDWQSSFGRSTLPHRSAEGLVLLVHATHMNIITQFYQTTQYETDWDRSLDLFAQLVEYAEEWMELTDPTKMVIGSTVSSQDGRAPGFETLSATGSASSSFIGMDSDLATLHTIYTPRQPTFTLATSIVTPIHFTAQRCRDPIVRRRALAILSACNIREGVFDSNAAAAIARQVIELEEIDALALSLLEGGGLINAAAQVQDRSRVREVDLDFGSESDGVGRLKFKRGNRKDGGLIESVEEVIQW